MPANTRCIHCQRPDTEPAGEKCKNPIWHSPVPQDALVAADDDEAPEF